MKKRDHENHVVTVSIDGAVVSRGTIKTFAALLETKGVTAKKSETLICLSSGVHELEAVTHRARSKAAASRCAICPRNPEFCADCADQINEHRREIGRKIVSTCGTAFRIHAENLKRDRLK